MNPRIQLIYDLAKQIWAQCAPFNAGGHPGIPGPNGEAATLEGAIAVLQDLLDQINDDYRADEP